MGSASFNSGCEVRRTHQQCIGQESLLKAGGVKQGGGYLEADDVGGDENADALEEISQSVNERRSDGQAALLAPRLAGR